MKAICASVNFDLFMVLPRPTARITHAAKLEFSSKDRSENREAGHEKLIPNNQVICQSGKAHAFIRVARAFLVGRHAVLHTRSGGLSQALRSRFTVVRQHGRYGV